MSRYPYRNKYYGRRQSNSWILWVIALGVIYFLYNQNANNSDKSDQINNSPTHSSISNSVDVSTSSQPNELSEDQQNFPASALEWDEAQFHEGEEAIVCGKIVATFDDSIAANHHYLYMGHNYGNSDRFTVLIRSNDLHKFNYAPATALSGKVICASGPIETFRGVPEIEVQEPSEITIIQ